MVIPREHRFETRDTWPLLALLAFTVIAIAGFVLFVAPPHGPENLAFLAQNHPALFQFYLISFAFFAQSHVWLTGLVLGFYLWRHAHVMWAGTFGIIYVLSLGSELLGTSTGLPFGPYGYTDLLGIKWFDLVPIVIPLSWFTMALPAYALARRAFPQPGQRVLRIIVGAYLLAAWDLALDPAMSWITSYWTWGEEGPYYGMPWINLFGWYITGIVLMAIMAYSRADEWVSRLSISWLSLYYFVVLSMPMGMIAAYGFWDAFGATLAAVIAGFTLVYAQELTGRTKADPYDRETNDEPIVAKGEVHPTSVRFQGLVPENLADFFSQNSRSFSYAASWFPQEERHLVTLVYAYCRATDDLVDEAVSCDDATLHRRLDDWTTISRVAYTGGDSGLPWLNELMQRSARRRVPFSLITELIAGVRMDVGQVDIDSVETLRLYSYRVASVVGIWMCHLFGVRDPQTLRHAAALGIAMQVTNIVRDVGEDLRRDRIYIPAELRIKYGISRGHLHAMERGVPLSSGYKAIMKDLMQLAEREYAYAWEAIPRLPHFFALSVAVAADVYRAIQAQVVRNDYDNFHFRARTSTVDKLHIGIRARLRLWRMRRDETSVFHMPSPTMGLETARQASASSWKAPVVAILILISALLPDGFSVAQTSSELERLRSAYLESAEDETRIVAGMALARSISSRTDAPRARAYDAAFEVMKARHAFWPMSKMDHVEEGIPQLDALVLAYPNDIEIRYLRLVSTYFIPSFLGYSDHLMEDFQMLANALPLAQHEYSTDMMRMMSAFVVAHGDIDQRQRLRLERLASEQVQQHGGLPGS